MAAARRQQQRMDHLVGGGGIVGVVLLHQLRAPGLLALGLALPEDRQRGEGWNEQADRVEEVAEIADDGLGAIRVAGDDNPPTLPSRPDGLPASS